MDGVNRTHLERSTALEAPTLTRRVAAAGAIVGGAAFAVAGALQVTGLDWKENAVETPLQHVAMALFAVALVSLVPALRALGRAWPVAAAGQLAIAAASTVSNIRGVDASWFPAAAIAGNAVWIAGTIALAVTLFRRRSRLLAAGIVVAYLGAIPLAPLGGGLLTGAYWIAVGYLLGQQPEWMRPLQVRPSSIVTESDPAFVT
jgi:hypothetical protein